MYSIYHRLMRAHSRTEFYPCPLVRFHLTKRVISKHRRPIVAMPLSEHVMTSLVGNLRGLGVDERSNF